MRHSNFLDWWPTAAYEHDRPTSKALCKAVCKAGRQSRQAKQAGKAAGKAGRQAKQYAPIALKAQA